MTYNIVYVIHCITTSTPIPIDDSDNAICVGGDAAIAAGSRGFSDPAVSITADAPKLSIDNDNTPVRRDSAAVTITTDSPSVADAANTSVDGVSAAAVAITSHSSDHSTDECCSDTFICTLCSAGVRMLFDQFKVEQSNSLKSVMIGLNSDLRDVRQENLDLKLPMSATQRKSRILRTVSLNVQVLPL